LNFRKRNGELEYIVSGHLATIATHLQHWLSLFTKDTKRKELERSENFFYHRQRSTNSKVKQVIDQNEQSIINSCTK
jgi:P2-related tail formation protein